MTRLLHECIAHHRSLDVRLDSLLSSRPDHNCTSSHSAAPPPLSSPSSALICPSSSPSSPPPPPSPIKSPLAFAIDITRRSLDIKDYDSITASRICCPLGFPKAEPREIETYLEEILSLMHMGEDYTEFMMSKIKGLGFVDPEFGSKAVKRLSTGSFNVVVQELIG